MLLKIFQRKLKRNVQLQFFQKCNGSMRGWEYHRKGLIPPLTPSPNIQAIPESSNVNAKIPKKTQGPNKLKGYVSSQSPRLKLRHIGRGQVVGTLRDIPSCRTELSATGIGPAWWIDQLTWLWIEAGSTLHA